METPRKKLYAFFHYDLEYPANNDEPLRYGAIPKPHGAYMKGVEIERTIGGRLVTVVRFDNGAEELLSNLVVVEDRRKQPR